MKPAKLIKRLLLISVILGSLLFMAYGQNQAPAEVNMLMALQWDTANDPAQLSGQRLYLSQSNSLVQRFDLGPAVTYRELTNIFTNFPNGVYSIHLTAVGKSAIESKPSSELFVFWYGNTPNSPTNLTIQFTRP
jgi:hypothetical protein